MDEFKTVIDTQNPLFNRREIEGEVHAEVTPSRAEVAQMLAKKFSAEIDSIKIRTIKGRFGSKTFVVVANIYASKKDKDETEAKSKRDAKQSPRDTASPSLPAQEPAEAGDSSKDDSGEPSGEPEVKVETPVEEASKDEKPKIEEQPKEEIKVEEKPEASKQENKSEEKTE